MTGEIQDRFVRLDISHRDRDRLGFGAFVFEVKGDGRRMDGVQATYNTLGGDFFSRQCTATRGGLVVRRRPSLDRALEMEMMRRRLEELPEAKIQEQPDPDQLELPGASEEERE